MASSERAVTTAIQRRSRASQKAWRVRKLRQRALAQTTEETMRDDEWPADRHEMPRGEMDGRLDRVMCNLEDALVRQPPLRESFRPPPLRDLPSRAPGEEGPQREARPGAEARYPLMQLQDAHRELRRVLRALEDVGLKLAPRLLGRALDPPGANAPLTTSELNDGFAFCIGAVTEELRVARRLVDLLAEAELATRARRAA